MSTALASPTHAGLGSTHFLLRRLHSLTGIVFGLYICVHLLINATLVEGTLADQQGSVFQHQVDKIHSLPFLLMIEWIAIYIPILFHTIYGIFIIATGQPNVANYKYGKNWAYLFQRISAVILILFIAFHVFAMKGFLTHSLTFDPANADATMAGHIHASYLIAYIVYPIGVLAACFHLANGFWTAAITWGLTVSAQAQKRFGAVCLLVFLFTFGCGMTAWVSALRMPAPATLTVSK